MSYEQLFVGGTSIVLGLLSVVASACNHDFFFQLTMIKWIEKRGGRAMARATYALVGIVLIGVGIAIAMGFAPNASTASH